MALPMSRSRSLALQLALLLGAIATMSSPTRAMPDADFVVLGGGTAGCTTAAEICKQLPKATVTVVERGSPRSRRVRRVSSAARLIVQAWDDPALTQTFLSTPNPGMGGRRMGIKLGANLGGSSAVNAARFTLPPAWYYNTLGIAGLDAARSFSLFQRVRSALRPAVPDNRLLTDYSATWVSAANRAGLPFNADPLTARNVAGAWPEHIAFDKAGRRVDAFRGFLKPAMAGACKGRVRIVRGATVRRVKFAGKRAVSAEVQHANGRVETIGARREILLAAGAVNTAAVLQRSGVGPKTLLNGLSVPVVADLPVGKHVQTRHVVSLLASYESALARVNNLRLLKRPWVTRAFDAGRGGPLGVSPYGPAARLPGLGYLAMRAGFEGNPPKDADGTKRLGTTSLVNPAWNAFGSVRITSRDAAVPPQVDMNLLGHAGDLDRSVRMTKKVREIFAQLSGPMGVKELLRPGETPANLNDAAVLEKKIRAQSFGTNHYAGGAAVGRVLNSRLSVKGVSGLRVVDAGAIQRIPPNAGPLGTVYIVAVRAGDIVAEDHGDLK